jgi:hypothetical protein
VSGVGKPIPVEIPVEDSEGDQHCGDGESDPGTLISFRLGKGPFPILRRRSDLPDLFRRNYEL